MVVSHCKVMGGHVTHSIMQTNQETTNNRGDRETVTTTTTTTVNFQFHLLAGNLHHQVWLALHMDLRHLPQEHGHQYRLNMDNLLLTDIHNPGKVPQATVSPVTTTEVTATVGIPTGDRVKILTEVVVGITEVVK